MCNSFFLNILQLLTLQALCCILDFIMHNTRTQVQFLFFVRNIELKNNLHKVLRFIKAGKKTEERTSCGVETESFHHLLFNVFIHKVLFRDTCSLCTLTEGLGSLSAFVLLCMIESCHTEAEQPEISLIYLPTGCDDYKKAGQLLLHCWSQEGMEVAMKGSHVILFLLCETY